MSDPIEKTLEIACDEPLEEVERAWLQEARRRLDALRAEHEQLVPWDEARKRIFAKS